MTKKGSAQLKEYRAELKKIITELETIERHIRNDYKNVGNVQCADSINSVINKYKNALATLNSVDASILDILKDATEAAKTAIKKTI
ncbi:MAG: hypothetical protein KH285_06355 [Anaerotruncus sp.]|nr:hypothetical protein [Anaerotruncus sp.]